jgi:hypothetical protein
VSASSRSTRRWIASRASACCALWGAAREFRLEAEIVELRAEVRRQDAELDRAHNDMASSLEREGRLEVHCEELLASAKDSQKKMKGLIAISRAHLTASE